MKKILKSKRPRVIWFDYLVLSRLTRLWYRMYNSSRVKLKC